MKKILFPLLLLSITIIQAQTNGKKVNQGRKKKSEIDFLKKPSGLLPDYTDLYFWAAHPAKKDPGDTIPPFLASEERLSLSDVFFLHPTTYTKGRKNSSSNAPLDDIVLNDITDKRTIQMQSSVFNNCGRIYAPRYRQAHIKAFMSFKSDASKAAFNLAYEDLKTAFQYYLNHENKGRPIIIASHSQGSMHAIRLLQDFFDGKPLQKQLVCAYIVGWQIKPDDFKNIPVGDKPDATGCFVGWRSYKKGELDFVTKHQKGGSVCVNPISWTTSTGETEPELHKGALAKDMNKLIKGDIVASIAPGYQILWVKTGEKLKEKLPAKMKNYHVADYNLFWLDIRENALKRVKSFLKIN